jgi:hypothetical protein
LQIASDSESLFRDVALKRTGSDPAYVLKGNIERLEEVDDGRDVRVVCTISAQLVDTHTRSIIWSGSESQTVAVENRNVPGIVSSLSAAAQLTIDNPREVACAGIAVCECTMRF